MALQLDPLVDIPGTLIKQQDADAQTTQAGVLQASQNLKQMEYNRQVGKEDQLQQMMPQLLQKYRSGDQSAFMQIAQLNPKMAETLLQMDDTNSQVSLRSIEVKKAQQEIVQQAKAQKLASYTKELAVLSGLQSNLSGIESPAEKTKVLSKYRDQAKAMGIDVPPLLKGDWTPEMDKDIQNLSTLGNAMVKSLQTPEPYTLGPGEKRFDANNRLVADNPKNEPIKVAQNETLVDPNTMKPLYSNGSTPQQDNDTAKQDAANALNAVDKAINFMGGGDASGNPNPILGNNPSLEQRVNAAGEKGKGSGGLGWAQLTSWIQSSDAGTLKSIIDTVNSETAIDTLKQMKAQSKTGSSGMGALSEKELDLLLSKVTSLKVGMDPKVLANNLLEIRQHWQHIQNQLDISQSDEVKNARPDDAKPKKVLTFDPATGELK